MVRVALRVAVAAGRGWRYWCRVLHRHRRSWTTGHRARRRQDLAWPSSGSSARAGRGRRTWPPERDRVLRVGVDGHRPAELRADHLATSGIRETADQQHAETCSARRRHRDRTAERRDRVASRRRGSSPRARRASGAPRCGRSAAPPRSRRRCRSTAPPWRRCTRRRNRARRRGRGSRRRRVRRPGAERLATWVKMAASKSMPPRRSMPSGLPSISKPRRPCAARSRRTCRRRGRTRRRPRRLDALARRVVHGRRLRLGEEDGVRRGPPCRDALREETPACTGPSWPDG